MPRPPLDELLKLEKEEPKPKESPKGSLIIIPNGAPLLCEDRPLERFPLPRLKGLGPNNESPKKSSLNPANGSRPLKKLSKTLKGLKSSSNPVNPEGPPVSYSRLLFGSFKTS